MSKVTVSRRVLLAFVLTTLAGACLHFLYDLFPNAVTAIISPVNESIWEHLKLIYWPYLTAMLLVTGKAGKEHRGSWLFSLFVICIAMLAAGYLYHISFEGDRVAFDIGLYVVLMSIGFWLPSQLKESTGRSSAVFFLIVLLGVAIVLFTFLPPDHILFADLSSVHTWYSIPF